MKTYIGTKIIQAKPMTRGEYNNFRGWQIPQDENPNDDGYLVKYPDGYISWSPKQVFEDAYRIQDGLTFGLAIEALKQGKKVSRAGWNGKDMFIYLVQGTEISVPNLRNEALKHVGTNRATADKVIINSHIDMKSADGSVVVGWLASQTDMLAEDWEVVE